MNANTHNEQNITVLTEEEPGALIFLLASGYRTLHSTDQCKLSTKSWVWEILQGKCYKYYGRRRELEFVRLKRRALNACV